MENTQTLGALHTHTHTHTSNFIKQNQGRNTFYFQYQKADYLWIKP